MECRETLLLFTRSRFCLPPVLDPFQFFLAVFGRERQLSEDRGRVSQRTPLLGRQVAVQVVLIGEHARCAPKGGLILAPRLTPAPEEGTRQAAERDV